MRGEESQLATAVKDAMGRPKITLLDMPSLSWDIAPNVASEMSHLSKLPLHATPKSIFLYFKSYSKRTLPICVQCDLHQWN